MAIDWDAPDSEWGGHVHIAITDDLGNPDDKHADRTDDQ